MSPITEFIDLRVLPSSAHFLSIFQHRVERVFRASIYPFYHHLLSPIPSIIRYIHLLNCFYAPIHYPLSILFFSIFIKRIIPSCFQSRREDLPSFQNLPSESRLYETSINIDCSQVSNNKV